MYLGALKRVLRYGWTRHNLGDKSVGFCIIGAIDDYYLEADPPYGTRNTAIHYLERILSVTDLAKWNDSEATVERVVDVLLRGAETADRILPQESV